MYTLYQCYKLHPLLSEETTKKLFWKSVTVAVCVVVVINSSKVVVAFQDVKYSLAEIVVLICIGFLFLVPLRINSFTETINSHKYMKGIIIRI